MQGMSKEVEIPRSVRGLVTPRLLVMGFVPGTQITRLKGRINELKPWQKMQAKRRILSRVTAAYGHMLLINGLFQADAHPGNILVQPGMALLLAGHARLQLTPTMPIGITCPI